MFRARLRVATWDGIRLPVEEAWDRARGWALPRQEQDRVSELAKRKRRSSKRTAPMKQLTDPPSQPSGRRGTRLASELQPARTITDPADSARTMTALWWQIAAR